MSIIRRIVCKGIGSRQKMEEVELTMDVVAMGTLGWLVLGFVVVWVACGVVAAIIVWANDADERAESRIQIRRAEEGSKKD